MDVLAMVAVARSGIENLRPHEVMAEMKSQKVLLIDVREPAETADGSIQGAVFTPRGTLEFCADLTTSSHDEGFDLRRRTILCSATGRRSALAGHTLQAMGYLDVAHLEGGLEAWVAAGFLLT
ncbi:MAG: rhodanese-like domain-containing protein [Aeromicrobium sp.]